jgi:hypothetical protein
MRRIPPEYGVIFTSIDTTLGNFVTTLAPLTGAAIAAAIGIPCALRLASLVTLGGFVLFAIDALRARTATP